MKYFSLLILIFLFSGYGPEFRQNIEAKDIKLADVYGHEANIPFLGKKVFLLFYIDPDKQHITDPLTNVLDSKEVDMMDFEVVTVINCKDTWIPFLLLRTGARQEQKRYPDSPILLDRSHLLSSAWNFGECDNISVVVIVDKESRIIYMQKLVSEVECRSIVPAVLNKLKDEVN
jgi:hypothetical protein